MREQTRETVVVAIPALNEARSIEAVLDDLSDDLPPGQVIFAVADGGSTDGTQDIIGALAKTRKDIVLMHNEARLQSAGVNKIADTFRNDADILVRCDAHSRYPSGYVRRLVESLHATGADSVVVPMDAVGDTCLQKAIAWVSDSLIGSGGAAHRGGRRSAFVDHGHHAAISMKSFCCVGGYERSFSHNEDAEFDCRLRALGGKIFLDSDIRVEYRPRRTFSGLFKQYFNYGRGRSRTARRHPRSLRLRQVAVPAFLSACLLAIALSPVVPMLLLLPFLYLAALAASSLAIALKKRSACGLLAGPAALTMHAAWAAGFLWGLATLRERRWLGAPLQPAENAVTPGKRRNIGKKTVLLVDPSLFTAPYDAGLASGLKAGGLDVIWAARPLRAGEQDELPEGDIRVEFYRHVDRFPGRWSKFRAVAKGLSHISGLIRLMAYVIRNRVEIVHLQWAVLPFLDAAAMGLLRPFATVIMTVHDTVPFNGATISFLQNAGFDLPIAAARHVIVHTRTARQTLIGRGVAAEKITVVPHGPIALQVTAAPSTKERDRRWTFVQFGQIKPYKGVDMVVEAVGALPPRMRETLRVVIAGAPHMDMAAIAARARELKIGDTIEFRLGRFGEQEMADLFEEADSFLLPYRQIDASGVYFLLKPLGKWIIASQVGIFAEDMMTAAHGTLVPPGDIEALASAIGSVSSLRPAATSPSDSESWEVIGARTAQVYDRAAGGRRGEASEWMEWKQNG